MQEAIRFNGANGVLNLRRIGLMIQPSGFRANFVDIPFKTVPRFRRSGAEIPHRRQIARFSRNRRTLAEIGLLLFGMTALRRRAAL